MRLTFINDDPPPFDNGPHFEQILDVRQRVNIKYDDIGEPAVLQRAGIFAGANGGRRV